MKQECKDCNKSLDDCTCIEDTIEFPKQEPKKVLTEEDIFNQKDIDAVTDYINRETSKQETLEEVAERIYPDCNNVIRQMAKETFIKGAKWQQEQNDTSKVKRVEVIQHSPPYNGRAFTKYNAKDVEIQFQDDGRTLKIFLK